MDRCPYIRGLRAGNEYLDYCKLTEKPSGRIQICELMRNDKCETWEEIKSEDGYDEYLNAGVMPGNLDNKPDEEYTNTKEGNND